MTVCMCTYMFILLCTYIGNPHERSLKRLCILYIAKAGIVLILTVAGHMMPTIMVQCSGWFGEFLVNSSHTCHNNIIMMPT